MPPRTAQPDQVLQFFETDRIGVEAGSMAHGVAQDFQNMALDIAETLPKNPQRSHCLHKLLEARDYALRSALTRTD